MPEIQSLALLALFLHNLGYVFGTGAATLVNVFNIVGDKNELLRPAKPAIMNVLAKFVWTGFILMIIVHTGELVTVYVKGQTGSLLLLHWAKVITIYGGAVGFGYVRFVLFPRAKASMPQPGESPTREFLSVRKKLMVFPLVILGLWGVDFVLNTIWEPTDAFGFLNLLAR